VVVQEIKNRHPFKIDAMVVLPDTCMLSGRFLPMTMIKATRWTLIKAAFSRNTSRTAKGERGIWQRRYREHLIRDDQDLNRHVDYIHYNPVKHGHAQNPADWPHSSIHQYIKGTLPASWGSGVDFGNTDFSET
jgi:putative transposase